MMKKKYLLSIVVAGSTLIGNVNADTINPLKIAKINETPLELVFSENGEVTQAEELNFKRRGVARRSDRRQGRRSDRRVDRTQDRRSDRRQDRRADRGNGERYENRQESRTNRQDRRSNRRQERQAANQS